MTPEDFEFLSTMVKRESGLILTEDKSYLLESRLMPLARKRELGGLEDLVQLCKKGTDSSLVKDITEAMTTNESFFFRDIKPFDIFRDATLPFFLDRRSTQRSVRIWCAAASSGQEPYSLAMVLNEMSAKFMGWKTEIIGTDISTEILEKASNGLYSQFEVQRGLPVQFLVKYFEKVDENWQISKALRDMIQYKEFNLLDSLTPLGKFDIVFCRNVLIYFDQETKGKVLDRICDLMPNDGLLFLGGAETVLGISDKFKPVPNFRGIYQVSKAKEEDAFENHPAVIASTQAGG
ncbi:MAG: protein-glutamate O-methyltransferase [Rhodospirillaceae bacterium]|jgi:chemotaxis protein methyltransferase CheR|nr:protein-glutamate O-methyltransferase [Rhodospirillaceae bacterium]MBT4589145.1 protein-glutamate O-methyltransferase [Rhodospirillaceae bacterium]MBT4938353.1 protein-glutamate O-methyltransferase [Rhodospirillaceae bacterium]MBT5941359.1 protein-glutamate O-methyltransferase [Rhodospirillaceae bacterium]MBT7268516.1 protein-glutamate O-methyltransferase [Rhodospirillaceae bacterium]